MRDNQSTGRAPLWGPGTGDTARTAGWPKRMAIVLTAMLLGVAAASAIVSLQAARAWDSWAVDVRVWIALGHRWLETGSLYAPFQLAGPYPANTFTDVAQTPGLYPPAAGPVFALVALLPTPLLALWWLVPIAILCSLVAHWRPAWWTWPLIAACLAWPQTLWQFIVGGTSMWMAALVAAGFVWPGVAALILLKPTLALFALIGIRNWRWWTIVAAITVLTLLGPWRDYLVAIVNGRDSGGLRYSLGHYPLMLIPVFAWLGRHGRPPIGKRRVGGARGEEIQQTTADSRDDDLDEDAPSRPPVRSRGPGDAGVPIR